MTATDYSRKRSNVWTLLAFIVGVVGIGFLIGFLIRPDEWYRTLAKPWFNPPNWVFGPVWAIIYVLIAIAGWRTWVREGESAAFGLWVAQLSANFMWTPSFFGLHSIGLALLVIITLLCLVAAFITNRWSKDSPAALLFVPYAVWVAFATILNAAVFLLNL
jgi:translocator protein